MPETKRIVIEWESPDQLRITTHDVTPPYVEMVLLSVVAGLHRHLLLAALGANPFGQLVVPPANVGLH